MRRFLFLLLILCSLAFPVFADAYYPALSNPVDQALQRLAVMSQRDSAFEGAAYNGGLLSQRGCQPVSLANAVIASFGVTDRETAIGVVLETADLLVPPQYRTKGPADMACLDELIDPRLRASEYEKYPYLAQAVGSYCGEVTVSSDRLAAQEVIKLICTQQLPAVIASRVYVHPDWTDVVQILFALNEMGLHEATVCLANAGAGTESSGAPLRSGKSGHYLTALIHVGAFMEHGTVYVLDSLPRALEEEESGEDCIFRRRYLFGRDSASSAFTQTYTASRISPTVIKLDLRPQLLCELEKQTGEAAVAQRIKQLKPLILYGSCVLMISLPETTARGGL